MNLGYSAFENSFIGPYVNETSDVYDKAKIRLIFKFAILSVLSIILSLPSIYNMNRFAFVIAFFALISISAIPFLLKVSRSLKLTGGLLLTLSYISLVNIYFLLNRPDPMGIGAWFIAIIIISSFTLGRNWGIFFFAMCSVAVLVMTYFKLHGISVYNIPVDFDPIKDKSVLISTPLRALAPITIVLIIIQEFLTAERISRTTMNSLFESQNVLIDKLKASETKYRKFIEDADDPIYTLDDKGHYNYINPAFEKIGGYTLSELRGKDFNFFVCKSYQTALQQQISRQIQKKGRVGYYEFPIINKEGTKIWIGQKVKMVFENGRMLKAICIARDITEGKRIQEALIEAKEKAVKATKAKADFLSSMSHEIRTPMNAVFGMTDLLLMDNPRKDQIENLNTIKFSTKNLLSIINDILDFSKIESGNLSLEASEIDLKYILHSIHNAFSAKAAEKGIKLLNKMDPVIPKLLKGDSVRISQILNNLIGNAIKFTNKGYVIVQTSLQKAEEEHVIIDFSILDSGIGIPSDRLESIFENFTQAASNTTRKFGGTGLGLAITKRLVELHGSDIKVQSTLGKGAHFSFSIKFEKCKTVDIDRSESFQKERPEAVTNLKNVNILLAEDNKVNQLVIKKFISRWGAKLEIVENGLEAIEILQKEKFDLVLMDLQMPVMGGFEATSKIRKLGEVFEEIPIIALTASVVQEIQDEAIKAGMNDFLTKPFDPNMLLSKIKTYALAQISKEVSSI